MLDDLVTLIETLQKRIRDHNPTLRENETRTRVALIDPLLTALGWDVSDPALVTLEYSVSGHRADYALLHPNGKPEATIEAKKLGEVLVSHRMQMLNYSNASGVEYAGLTDGDHWELYEVFQRGQLEDRRILDISIATTPAYECALKLLLLWRPNLASGRPIEAEKPLWPLVPQPSPIVTELVPVPQEPPSTPLPPSPTGWVSLREYNPPAGSKPPTSIRFQDGSLQGIQYWKDILVKSATWLHSTGRLTADMLPVRSSPRIYIVNSHPSQPTGNDFSQHEPIANGLIYVNTHASAIQVRQNTRRLLNHCGVSPDTVQLQVGE